MHFLPLYVFVLDLKTMNDCLYVNRYEGWAMSTLRDGVKSVLAGHSQVTKTLFFIYFSSFFFNSASK